MYVYQRINTLVAHHDNRISLRVHAGGIVEMRFPPYTPQAGVYRWQADAGEMARLDALFAEAVRLEQGVIERAQAQRSGGDLVVLADADVVRFEIRAQGRAARSLVVESPEAWSRALPDSTELAQLARTESEILDWMRARTRALQP